VCDGAGVTNLFEFEALAGDIEKALAAASEARD
jgi:hypothetical protein